MKITEIPHTQLAQRLGNRVVEIATEFKVELATLLDAPFPIEGIERSHTFNLSDGRVLHITLSADLITDGKPA